MFRCACGELLSSDPGKYHYCPTREAEILAKIRSKTRRLK